MFYRNKTQLYRLIFLATLVVVGLGTATPQAAANHFGGTSSWDTGCGGTVSVSKSASGSGTSPNGQISVSVSTSNACTGVNWAIRLNAHAGPNTQYSGWLYGWGTGQSQTFTFSNLGAGDYSVSGDAEMWWWNGSTYVYWNVLSTTVGFVTISNPPPPPPPPPPPSPNTPSLSGPTQVYYGNTANYSWSAVPNASYYLFGCQYKDASNNSITCGSGSMEYVGNTTSKSLTVTTNTNAKKLYGILIACGDGGCGSFSNSLEANVYELPTASNVTAEIKARITGSGDTGWVGVGPGGGITVPHNTSIDIGWNCIAPVGSPTYVLVYQEAGAFNSSLSSSPGVTIGNMAYNGQNPSYRFQEQCGTNPVTVAGDPDTIAVDYVEVIVQAPTLDVSMSHSASPTSHTLSGGQVVTSSSVVVGGTATGNITYNFNCNNGSAVQTTTTSNTNQSFSCTYTSAGTFNPSVSVSRSGISASTNEFVSIYSPVTVDIKANNSNGPISLVTGGSGNPANLTWTSSNASSCTSSGSWGNFGKSLNNTTGESTGALSASTYTYTLTCSNSGGSSVSDSVTINVTSPPTLKEPQGSIGCQGTPSTANTFNDVTWTANWTGGNPPYSYKWSGPGTNSTSNTSASRVTTYASTGSKSETIRVTSSDGQTLNMSCGSVQVYYPSVTGSCSANKNSISTGESVTWSVNSVSGGSGSYSYSWSGTDSLSGNQSSTNTSYSSAGTKTATVRITSGTTQNYPSGTNNYTDVSCTIPSGGSSLPVSYPAVDVTCYPDRSTTYPGQTVNWAVNYVTGGNGTYTYSWSGDESLSCSGQPSSGCSNVNKQYSQTGTKKATVTANSGGLSKSKECSSPVTVTATTNPTVSISAANTTISYRGDASISWTSANASSCSVTPTGWTGTSGSNKADQNLTTSKTYRVTCNGLNEKSSTQVSAEVRVKVTPQVTCSVSPTSVAVGSPVTWSATNPQGGDGAYSYSWSGDDGLSGTVASVPKTYTLPGGKNGTVTVTSDGLSSSCSPVVGIDVTVYSTMAVSCSASPTSTTVNNDVTWSATPTGGKTPYSYSWSVDVSGNSSSVTKKFNSTGTKNGTITVTSGDNQTKTCSASTVISNKPSVSSFTTPDADIIQGESTTLSWACADSTTSTGSGFNTGGVTSGSVTVSPNSTTTYTITCSNGIGESASSNKIINVTPQSITASISISPISGRAPLDTTITATAGGVAPAGLTQNYSIWWNCNSNATTVSEAVGACNSLPAGVWGTCQTNSIGAKCDGISNTTQQISHTYSSQGDYTPKVIIERGPAPSKEARTSITVDYPPVGPPPGQPPAKTCSANSPCSFSVQGGTGSYSWDAPNRCTPRTGSGSTFTVSCNRSGSYTITVTSGNQTFNFTLIVASTILNFSANPPVVNPGQSTVLSWLTTGYQSCSIDQGIGSVATDSGTKTLFYKEGVTQVTYTLTCMDNGNKQDASQITVKVSKVPILKEIIPK